MAIACFACAVPIAFRVAVSESPGGAGFSVYDFDRVASFTDVASAVGLGMSRSCDLIDTLATDSLDAGFTDSVGAAF